MQLIDSLLSRIDTEDSMFRAQLMREDVARLRRVAGYAGAADSLEAFMKDALYCGWTPDDMRTHELKETLTPLLEAIFARISADDPALDQRIIDLWPAFDAHRMERLVGCLARVPKPA